MYSISYCSPPLSGDIPNMTAFEKNGLRVVFTFQRSLDPTTPAMVAIILNATNSTPSPMTDFVFQCAVPKVCQWWCVCIDQYIVSRVWMCAWPTLTSPHTHSRTHTHAHTHTHTHTHTLTDVPASDAVSQWKRPDPLLLQHGHTGHHYQ